MKIKFSIILLTSLIFIFFGSSCTSKKTAYSSSMRNMVATVQMDEEVEGVCDNSNVISVMPIPGNGQSKAVPSMNDEALLEKLNKEVVFLKDKSDYSDKGMIGLIINCQGKMVQCKIDNKTKSPELDAQIVAVFATLETWKVGTMHGKPIDTMVLYSFKIKDGKISFN